MHNRALSHLSRALPLAIGVIVGLTDHIPVFAQLTPDNTLGAENSTVTVEQLRDLIRGGAIRGNALFHSFEEFNVNELGQNGQIKDVYFDLQNNSNILNILTRVTGNSSSQILGTLGVLNDVGNANLFLLNPNGITFGGNASLDLNGSFFATTADGFGFDNFTFSASNPETPPLLTVSIPRFLSFRDNPGNIAVNQSNLRVNPGQNISLIGGNVEIDGDFTSRQLPDNNTLPRTGVITARGGRVELGGLSSAGTVTINPDSSLTFPENIARGDVTLTRGSSVYVRSSNGGDISVNAANLLMTGQSELFAGIEEGTTNPDAQAGDIVVNATESVRIVSTVNPVNASTRDGSIQVIETAIRNHVGGLTSINFSSTTNTQGNSGNVIVNAPVLQLINGGRLTTKTFGSGDAGNVIVNTDSLELDGIFSSLVSQVSGGATGNSGDINVTTNSLVMRSSQTNLSDSPGGPSILNFTFGNGNSGDITINAEEITLTGLSTITNQIFSTGNAGNISITTNTLDISDTARIELRSFSDGDVGNATINADSITLSSAGYILTDSEGNGSAGDINITANSLSLIGDNTITNPNNTRITSNTFGQGNAGNINLNINEFINISDSSTITAISNPNNDGDSGTIDINTDRLTITNNSFISVNSQGNGNAGSIEISGNLLDLDNGGWIRANSRTGKGGNVVLNSNVILLRNSNDISATGEDEPNVITFDGNIQINTRALVLLEGSQILTNASNPEGGSNIEIDSDIVLRARGTRIEATGDLNIDSDLVLETTEPPEVETTDPDDTVAQSVCSDFGGGGQLRNTGRSGMLPTPELAIRSEVVNVDLVDEVLPAPPPEAIKPHHRTNVTFLDSEGEEFKPAMGAVLLPNGMVQFVDYNPAEVYRDMYAAAGCLSNK